MWTRAENATKVSKYLLGSPETKKRKEKKKKRFKLFFFFTFPGWISREVAGVSGKRGRRVIRHSSGLLRIHEINWSAIGGWECVCAGGPVPGIMCKWRIINTFRPPPSAPILLPAETRSTDLPFVQQKLKKNRPSLVNIPQSHIHDTLFSLTVTKICTQCEIEQKSETMRVQYCASDFGKSPDVRRSLDCVTQTGK